MFWMLPCSQDRFSHFFIKSNIINMNQFWCLFALLTISFAQPTSNGKMVQYDQSLIQWEEMKGKNDNCYTYDVQTCSAFGFCSLTTLKVEKTEGKWLVNQRSYEEYNTQNGNKLITATYNELDQEIGKDQRGASPETIDELYVQCPAYLNKNEQNNYIYFTTNDDGIMSLCGYVSKDCADDCYEGIKVHSIQFCGV
eukprot:205654_1